MVKNIVSQLISLTGSVGIFSVGAEGSGKSTLRKGLEAACPQIHGIGFSSALESYLDVLSQTPAGAQYKVAISEARKAMAKRDKKSINPCLLSGALRHALRLASDGNQIIFDVDGWPRRDEQSSRTPNITEEFFPGCLMIVIEAECDRKEAFLRAVSCKGVTDTPRHIETCHVEYYGQLELMRSTYGQWAHHLIIDTNGSKEQTLSKLEEVLSELLSQLQQGVKLKTAGEPLELVAV